MPFSRAASSQCSSSREHIFLVDVMSSSSSPGRSGYEVLACQCGGEAGLVAPQACPCGSVATRAPPACQCGGGGGGAPKPKWQLALRDSPAWPCHWSSWPILRKTLAVVAVTAVLVWLAVYLVLHFYNDV